MRGFRQLLCVLATFVVTTTTSAQTPPPEQREADHQALRALLIKSAAALNTRNLDSVAAELHPAFTVITVDNQKLVGLEALKNYYAGLFDGPQAIVRKFEARPVADELTRFIDDRTGVVYGLSDDRYEFKDGDTRTMKTRWSAVVMKEGDVWKLVNVHFSANVLDNPLLDAARDYTSKLALLAGGGGLVVGGLLMAWLRRRPRA